MKKEEFIARYGEAGFAKMRAQGRAWKKAHQEEVKLRNNELNRKGGKRYEKMLINQCTGLPGEKHIIRNMHGLKWREYKAIIAPESQIHHEWIPDTSEFRGVALVEADRYMHGFKDVVEIFEGGITLLTEEEVRSKK